ncbi:MAG: GDSL-type esterase/lipase family protein [Chitinophagaceae bacterium]
MKYLATCVVLLISVGCLVAQNNASHSKAFFTSKPVTRIAVKAFYEYKFEAKDSVGNRVTYAVSEMPAWLKYDPSSNTISGNCHKAGQYVVQLLGKSVDGECWQKFMLTVYDKQTTNILCLGNSLTNGTNKYNSYRRDLWQMLHAAKYNFDFIGSWNKHHVGGPVPNDDFDTDHDGHSGWTINNMFAPPGWDSIRGNINDWLKNYKPDIVLIELGTNDVFQCVKLEDMMKGMRKLVEILRANNKAVKIFIAQIPPLGAQWADKKLCGDSVDYKTVLKKLNEHVALYSSKINTKISPVKAVDQFTGVNPAIDMYDDIHPNDAGEKKMAERWFAAIRGYLKKLP